MHHPLTDGEQLSVTEDHHLHPRRPVLIVTLVLAALTSGSALAYWMQKPGEAAYVGYVQVSSKPVTSGRDAQISEVLVTEGQVVEPGAPLFVLADPRLEADLAATKQAVKRLDAELSQAQARAVVELQWRLDELDQAIFESRLKSTRYLQDKLAHEVEQIAHKDLINRFKGNEQGANLLGDIRQIGQDQRSFSDEHARMDAMLKLHESENAIEVASAQIELCDARISELEQLKAELPEKVRLSMGIHVAEARLAEAQDNLRQLEAAQEELTLRAKVAGTIGVLALEPGAAVTASQPLVDILDPDQRCLVLNVPSTDVDRFEKGTELDLEFPNSMHREGRVVKTSTQALPPAGGDAAGNRVTEIAVHVEPAGKLWPTVPNRTTIRVRPQE